MLSSGRAARRKVGVLSVRKSKSREARIGSKGRKAALKKRKVHLLRQRSRKVVQSRCSADRACVWPVVDKGLCIHHLRLLGDPILP
jgi:hypothetical protein